MTDYRLEQYRGKWGLIWKDGDKWRRQSLGLAVTDTDEDQARIQAAIAWRRMGHSAEPETDAWTFNDVFERVKADLTMRGKSYERNAYHWKNVGGEFGHLLVQDIEEGEIYEYISQRIDGDGASRSTVSDEMSLLRRCAKMAFDNAWISGKAPKVPNCGKAPPRDYYLTKPMFAQLLKGCVSPHVRLFCIMAVTTAARPGAILGLTWDRVDFDAGVNGQINLWDPTEEVHATKGRAIVPMNRLCRDALLEAYRIKLGDYVVTYDGTSRIASIKKGVYAAAKRAQIECSPYWLRHTAGVWMAEANVPMSVISQYMGHSSTKVTEKHYARYSPDYLSGAAAALDIDISECQEGAVVQIEQRKRRLA